MKIKDYVFLALVVITIMVFGFALGRSYTLFELGLDVKGVIIMDLNSILMLVGVVTLAVITSVLITKLLMFIYRVTGKPLDALQFLVCREGVWVEARADEIGSAIVRCIESNKEVPIKLIEKYNELIKEGKQ